MGCSDLGAVAGLEPRLETRPGPQFRQDFLPPGRQVRQLRV
ncbi:unnamed protein product [Linum tenue]|uniref:Uncharacterized protein n=1 Tax=Linum tenue TaxID=586396 RepID=A0AAV0QQD3_9ROSI|nr:unnamed protein product [Linum tenue]